ncbi:HvfC/BufC family peptide modification chaperone [Pseudomonas sp. HK3]
MNLSELQQQFFDAIIEHDEHFESNIIAQGELNNQQRISIYQNAYFARLKETIETDHEILGRYLGDDLFDEMAAGYIKRFPSKYSSLRAYAEHLPKFLSDTAPFKQYPVISELALFERFLLYAFDAAQAPRATIAQLQAIKPDNWPCMTFRLHPSTQLFSTQTNCVECWQALKIKQAPPSPLQQSCYWVIWRNQDRLTEFVSLEFIEYQFLQLIIQGCDFSMICDEISNHMNEQDVSQFAVNTLVAWLNNGIISALHV